MADTADTADIADTNPERIAKRIARAGIASRRAAEAMIAKGRVQLNGQIVATPATLVRDSDSITVDGNMLPKIRAPRLWLYHKPAGLLTTHSDEKGRRTIFDTLAPELGRVISVGRLDLNSEGLLLLTNDGALKRALELPASGWLRRYRVRARGVLSDAALDLLRKGIEIDGVRYRPMKISPIGGEPKKQQQAANIWLSITLSEGKNREIRRALAAVGLAVNRLIRTSYGPFQLDRLPKGAVKKADISLLDKRPLPGKKPL